MLKAIQKKLERGKRPKFVSLPKPLLAIWGGGYIPAHKVAGDIYGHVNPMPQH